MRSEAVASLRSWMRDRLGEQEVQLRAVERSVTRLRDLDDERAAVVARLEAALSRLSSSGVDEDQVAGFVGVELAVLRTGPTPSTNSSRRTTAADPPSGPVNDGRGTTSGAARSGRGVRGADSTPIHGSQS
jgi:hypothetical protein